MAENELKTFTPEELAKNDGSEDRPTYVAVDGKVFDLSDSKKWIKGVHMKRHKAGCDLSGDIQAAPHGNDVLLRFELVGKLETPSAQPAEGIRGSIEGFLDRHPFFRRHPHPALVHIPIGLAIGAALFQILGLAFGSAHTEWAAYCCLILIMLSLPPTVATGYFTWWINYECADSPIITWKRRLGWSSVVISLVAVGIRTFVVESPIALNDTTVLTYTALLLGVSATVSITGFLGGKLTFPYE